MTEDRAPYEPDPLRRCPACARWITPGHLCPVLDGADPWQCPRCYATCHESVHRCPYAETIPPGSLGVVTSYPVPSRQRLRDVWPPKEVLQNWEAIES